MMNNRVLREVTDEKREDLGRGESWIERKALEKVTGYVELPHIVVISCLRRVGKSTLLPQLLL